MTNPPSWIADGDGFQTYRCQCGHRWVASILTVGKLERSRCWCGESIPEPPAREAECNPS